MADPAALLALVADAAFGWPAPLYRRIGHPVGLFARLITACETRWNRTDTSEAARRAAGIATVTLLLLMTAAICIALSWTARRWLGGWDWLGIGLLAAPALAQRSLDDHVCPVAAALGTDDLGTARREVAKIVGRDTTTLDTEGVSRAAIESLAESFCDGVVAPFFWLLLLGLPGVWAYKALNTADSMIGQPKARQRGSRCRRHATWWWSKAPARRPRSTCAPATSPIWVSPVPPMCRWCWSATSTAAA